ncbi:phenylacetate-CoA ligase [Halospina denitrificans]|uniref:Phenylacetate-CoA ligase n=1 Tax=Halospina denitrificans TaxID=332522 RepID=A0A4R7JQK5_9GAMM|nr:CoF synthetase [Halospina denitrificans]TDT39473.1 phenylacetate-CoA ligase [Halospina denitrificans]
MSQLYGLLRFYLTRLFYRALGIRVNYWRRQVGELWHMSPDERGRSLERYLAEDPLHDACGGTISKLAEINRAPRMSKEVFREAAGGSEQQGSAKQVGSRFARHTAGTTGAPTHITLNRTELGQMLGVRDYCFRHHGIRLGEAEARIWGRPDKGFKARLRDFLLNRRVYYPTGTLAETEVESLVKSQSDYIYGYASLILEAARLIEQKGWEPPPVRCVICTAETVLPSQKRYLEQVLKAPVVEEYGATEFDIIAFECREGHRHLVNPWLVVEAGDGQCLISDVSRKSQSIVRYELGDALTLRVGSCALLGSFKYIDQLEGRSINRFAYLSESEKFHSSEFANLIDDYQKEHNEIFRFRIEQRSHAKFLLSVYPCPSTGAKHLKEYICDSLYKKYNCKIILSVDMAPTSKSLNTKSGYFIQNLNNINEQN